MYKRHITIYITIFSIILTTLFSNIYAQPTSVVETITEATTEEASVINNYADSSKVLNIDARGAIGIFTITPSEGAIIAADVATKAADVSIGFVDRFNGTLIICGDVAAVESALREVMHTLCEMMGFTPTVVTKT